MKPFGRRGKISECERKFNYHLSSARRTVQNTFRRFKARFCFTAKRMECHVDDAHLVIWACCVPSEVCEHFSDSVHPQWLNEVQQSDAFVQPRCTTEAEVRNAADIRVVLVDKYSEVN